MIDYNWVMSHKDIFKLIFTIVISISCFVIVSRTHRIFKLSENQGVRYFRNAFLFYGLAFIFRYVAYTSSKSVLGNYTKYSYNQISGFLFEFFIVMAGFFMLYSLLYKSFETKKHSFSSLFNVRIFLFYLLAIVISTLDILWKTYSFMFFSQIIVFSFMGGLAFAKYNENNKTGGFLKLYFLVIILNLLAWILNFVVSSFFQWNSRGVILIYVLNIVIFVLFLYSVLNATRIRG